MGGEAAVGGDHSPLVAEGLRDRAADGNHRLDGEGHALEQPGAPLGTAIVRHLRLLVKPRADSMANELADDAVPRPFGDLLDRMPDVAYVVPYPGLRDPGRETFLGHGEQPLGLGRDRPDGNGRGRVGMKSLELDADVDAHD